MLTLRDVHRDSAGPGASIRASVRAGLVLLAVTVLFYWKTLLTHQFSYLAGYEATNQAYAWLSFWARRIHAGAWPWWDPYVFGGRIFCGEMQSQAFYPIYLPLALFPFNQHGMFSPALYHIMYAAIHFLGAFLMFRLVRELGLGTFAGVMAGICFSMGGVLGRVPDWPHMLNSGIWLPLIFLFLLRATQARRAGPIIRNAFAGGVTLGLSILAGGLHLAIMQAIVIVTAAVFAGFVIRDGAGGRELSPGPRTVLVIAVSGVAAFASGAVQLLPSIEYSRLAWRFVGAALPASRPIPYHYLADGIFAHGLINFAIGFPYGRLGPGEAINPYLGVFPLLLAVIGIWKNWRQPWVRYLTGLAIAAFVYALGAQSWLHGALYAMMPYLSLAREPSRFLYLADFALAILAAYGAESLFSPPAAGWEPLRRILKWVAIAAIVALAIPSLFAQPPSNSWVSLSLVLIVVAWLLFLHILSKQTGIGARALAVGLVLFDLYAFDWSATDRIEAAAKGQDEFERMMTAKPLVKFLKAQPGLFRVRMAMENPPNIGDVFGIQTTGGGGVTAVAEDADLLGHTDLLNVRYEVKTAAAADAGPIYQDATWKVYERPGAFPRAWIVHDTVIEPNASQLLRRLDAPDMDLHRSALLPAGLRTALDPAPSKGDESVTISRYEPDQLDLHVHAEGRALVVLSEFCYPGWRARVNSRLTRIWKVDGALRGIVVPAGDSHISLRYRPVSIYVGAALTLTCLAGMFLVGMQGLRHRGYPGSAPKRVTVQAT